MKTGHILWAVGICFTLGSCTVKYTFTKPDYDEVEKKRLKRVALVHEASLAENSEKRTALYTLVSREFITHHHEYIVLRPKKNLEFLSVKQYCAADKRLDGIIVSRFNKWAKAGSEVKLEIQATLYDCVSQARVWEALGANSYESEDSSLGVLIQSYSARVGKEIKDYVAPVYQLVRKLFQSLPDPALTDKDIEAKIEADADW